MYYGLLCVPVVLFSSQFLFQQRFQEECGTGRRISLIFTILGNGIGALLMLCMNGFRLDFSWFSFWLALTNGVVSVTYNYVAIKAFQYVNLSLFSNVAMLGGMLLPFIYGVGFAGEPFTLMKACCCVVIGISLFFCMDRTRVKWYEWLYCAAVFLLNGSGGVIAKIHESGAGQIGSTDFTAWSRITAVALSLMIMPILGGKKCRLTLKSVGFAAGYSVFNTIGNLLLLIALFHVPASVQYPIITGGVIACSTVISVLRKEKLTWKNYLSAALSLVATVLIILP